VPWVFDTSRIDQASFGRPLKVTRRARLRLWLMSIPWVSAIWRWLETFWKVQEVRRDWVWQLVAMPKARNLIPAAALYSSDEVVAVTITGFGLTGSIMGKALDHNERRLPGLGDVGRLTMSIGGKVWFQGPTWAFYTPVSPLVSIIVGRNDDVEIETEDPVRVILRGVKSELRPPTPILRRIRRALERVSEFGRYL
jgi:hypothetical protein